MTSIASRFILAGRPSSRIPTSTAIVSAMSGVPMKSRKVLRCLFESGATMSATARMSISTTGSRIADTAARKLGRAFAGAIRPSLMDWRPDGHGGRGFWLTGPA